MSEETQTATTKNQIAQVPWEERETIIKQEVEIVVKAVLDAVGVWDPHAASDF